MKILIIGSGGREHALAWKIAQSPRVEQIFVAPGNGGTSSLATNVPIPASDISGLARFAGKNCIDLTIVGPDDCLAAGVADAFKAEGLRIFGPQKAAARLESSKAFAKDFMKRHGIPCAESREFEDSLTAYAWCRTASYPLVVKADGLALGNGVIIARNPLEAAMAIHQCMDLAVFGAAGKKIIIEEFLEGPECSIHAIIDGSGYLAFPDARDHKRAYDGDLGPNTGGMGTISPSGTLDDALWQQVHKEILEPFVAGLRADKITFRGMLFPGLMLTKDGPKVLEFNCRFGDPETQVLVRRLDSDLLDLIEAALEDRVAGQTPKWSTRAACCVVMASGGYPGSYTTGHAIHGLTEASAHPDVVVFHAGTKIVDGSVLSSGGRVLGVTARGENLSAAQAGAYEAVEKISFEGHQFRRDIGMCA